jgi:hypothetical protein
MRTESLPPCTRSCSTRPCRQRPCTRRSCTGWSTIRSRILACPESKWPGSMRWRTSALYRCTRGPGCTCTWRSRPRPCSSGALRKRWAWRRRSNRWRRGCRSPARRSRTRFAPARTCRSTWTSTRPTANCRRSSGAACMWRSTPRAGSRSNRSRTRRRSGRPGIRSRAACRSRRDSYTTPSRWRPRTSG